LDEPIHAATGISLPGRLLGPTCVPLMLGLKMKSHFVFIFLTLCAIATSCSKDENGSALRYEEYYIPPQDPPSGTPDHPFDIPPSPTLKEQLLASGLTFDEPGSKLITMRLNFPGLVLLHTEEAHETFQMFLTEKQINWTIRE